MGPALGDRASQLQRKESVETVGILCELRGGAWVMQAGEDKPEHYKTLHWATLCEGAELAWRADKHKRNRAVQMSVQKGIPHSKLYSRKINRVTIEFLVYLGNNLNTQVTSITMLEVWRSTAVVEPAWARKKKQERWTNESLGKQKDTEKYKLINSLFPKRWKDIHNYRCSQQFFDAASKCRVDSATWMHRDLVGRTVWDGLVDLVQADVDLTQVINHERVMRAVNDVFRRHLGALKK
eukprot:9085683-Pyramimonas_sp.AAC.1